MTATRERSTSRRKLDRDERGLLRNLAGVPWWVAISIALGLTAVGAFTDIQRLDRLGIFFQACYCLGCLLAVILVKRKGLFGPIVAPPLILATAVPGVILLTGSLPTDSGTIAAALAVGTPLINGFPTMAITTGLTLTFGGLRLATERPSTAQRRRTEQDPETPDPEALDPWASDPGEPDTGRQLSRRPATRSPATAEPDDYDPPTEPIGPPIRPEPELPGRPAPRPQPAVRRRRRI